jgi:hypothetical protein
MRATLMDAPRMHHAHQSYRIGMDDSARSVEEFKTLQARVWADGAGQKNPVVQGGYRYARVGQSVCGLTAPIPAFCKLQRSCFLQACPQNVGETPRCLL